MRIETKCRCGRSLEPTHCPQCGRRWILAVKGLNVRIRTPLTARDTSSIFPTITTQSVAISNDTESTFAKATFLDDCSSKPSPKDEIFRGYRCRSCGTEWNTYDTPSEKCDAPPVVSKTITAKRRIESARESLSTELSKTGEDKLAYLRRLVESSIEGRKEMNKLSQGGKGET